MLKAFFLIQVRKLKTSVFFWKIAIAKKEKKKNLQKAMNNNNSNNLT